MFLAKNVSQDRSAWQVPQQLETHHSVGPEIPPTDTWFVTRAHFPDQYPAELQQETVTDLILLVERAVPPR